MAGQKKTLLAIGDSNTWGYNAKTGGRYPEWVRWTGRLRETLADVTVAEEGLCGRTTVFGPGFLTALEEIPFILRRRPAFDACVIMLGTNDCKEEYLADAETIGRGLEQCLDALEKKIPRGKILVVSPVLLGDGVWREGKDPEFDAKSVETCAELARVYRALCERRGHPFLAAQDYVTAALTDEEHLDEAGHAVFAGVIAQKLRDLKLV